MNLNKINQSNLHPIIPHKTNSGKNVNTANINSSSSSSSSPAAQTASVGDREMMTYMKLPIPSPSLEPNGASGNNTDSDDARFLDGLFERLSGSSDNGSEDKGKDDGSNSSHGSRGKVHGDSNIHGNGNCNTTRKNQVVSSGTDAAAVTAGANVPEVPVPVSNGNSSSSCRSPGSFFITTANHRHHPVASDRNVGVLPVSASACQGDGSAMTSQNASSVRHGLSFGGGAAAAARRGMSDISSLTSSSSSNLSHHRASAAASMLQGHGHGQGQVLPQQQQQQQHHFIFRKNGGGCGGVESASVASAVGTTNGHGPGNVHQNAFLTQSHSQPPSLSQTLKHPAATTASASASNLLFQGGIPSALSKNLLAPQLQALSQLPTTGQQFLPSWMMTAAGGASVTGTESRTGVAATTGTTAVRSSLTHSTGSNPGSSSLSSASAQLPLHTMSSLFVDPTASSGAVEVASIKGQQSRDIQDNNRTCSSHRRKAKSTSTPNHILSSTSTSTSAHKRELVSSISEDEDEREKRRRDRNMREQERSQRITQQISELKGILAASNVPFKPDKYSTLVSVHSYIKTLQQRAALLDEEQRKLVDTITQSNELVHKSQHGFHAVGNGQVGSSDAVQSALGHAIIPSTNTPRTEDDEILVLVRGLDYKNVFSKISIALCVTSIDGRLIDCNDEFVRVCGLSWSSLVSAGLREPQNESEAEYVGANPLSLFNLMAREDMQKVFEAMSAMLKTVQVGDPTNENTGMLVGRDGYTVQRHPSNLETDYWSSDIRHCRNSFSKLQLNISLVRNKNGTPRFFNCALTPIDYNC